MKTGIIAFIIITCFVYSIRAQEYQVEGRVISEKKRTPVSFAAVTVPAHGLWAVAGMDGKFILRGVPGGRAGIVFSCLGHVKRTVELHVTGDTTGVEITLQEDNLLLDAVEVTARRERDDLATSYTMDRAVLDHLQVLQVTDVMSLLPGGSTNRAMHLATTSPQRFILRGASGEMGNVPFGTAVEVDGVRLSTNAAFGGADGADVRNISSSNVESVEVVTGIPSVEHGDMTQGVVRINTRAGLSPFVVELATRPHTKHLSVNKGFALGARAGVLNASAEHVKSISDLASPYTSYDRNGLSLTYTLAMNGQRRPLRLTAGVTGNVGGYDSKSDPDAFTGTYTKDRDNTVRGHANLNWLLRAPWITSLEVAATFAYSDKRHESRSRQSGAASTVAIHGKEEGYFVATSYDENPDAPIVYIPPGYWYQLAITDSKPVSYSARVKARWFRSWGAVDNTLLLGAEYTATGNLGKGLYYDDPRYAPTWRAYPYDEVPFMHNVSPYVEESLNLSSRLRLAAGLRSDITSVRGAEYGVVNSLSPRVNVKYTAWEGAAGRRVSDLSARFGWGKSVKLPAFSTLYPAPSYTQKLAFAPGAMEDGTIFYAYHVMPEQLLYNPGLKWQYSTRQELAVEAKVSGVSLSLVFFRGVNHRSYTGVTRYTPFSYKLTDQTALESCPIPSADRAYSIDRNTGVVTVTDKTGAQPARELDYLVRNTFTSRGMPVNGSPSTRQGVEWVVDFGRIRALNTSIRWDGSYYDYKGIEESITSSMPNSTQNMADGNPYKYVGFYAGSSTSSNGTRTKRLASNVTIATHIPAARLIFSLRVEASLYSSSQSLSEYGGGQRGFVLESKESYMPSATETDIYGGNRYIGVYPLYYTTFEDMETKIPFAEKFAWAMEHDRALYNELAKMVVKTNYLFMFDEDKISPYYSANISVTKEIGNFATISFNATNATHNMGRVTSSRMNTESSLYGSGRIPAFYYGLSLKLKL